MEATDGQCILYEGRPVLAVFHSSSAGATQDAADVWSASLPYLRSVETPEDEEAVPGYRSTVSFQAAQLKELLRAALPEAEIIIDAACTAGPDAALHEKALDLMEALQMTIINR